jgi:hypothetical protein
LSAIRFINISRKKWGWTNQYKIICDNQAMIEILQENVKVEDTYPNIMLTAEWDVISETKTTMDKGDIWDQVQFQHIKGHADRDQCYNKLTLMQKLNINADRWLTNISTSIRTRTTVLYQYYLPVEFN